MLTPSDWQEGIGHRAQYVENRLRTGVPVVGVSLDAGIVIGTFRHQSRKVFEIYDRIVYSALGVAGDVEALRTASIDFCHQEGFRRSEEDVTVRRVVAAISEPVKEAFSNFRTVPMTVRAMFGEIGETADHDVFYVLDYDGDFGLRRGYAHLAGTTEVWDDLAAHLGTTTYRGLKPEEAAEMLKVEIANATEKTPDFTESELVFEGGFLDRRLTGDRKFSLIAGGQEY